MLSRRVRPRSWPSWGEWEGAGEAARTGSAPQLVWLRGSSCPAEAGSPALLQPARVSAGRWACCLPAVLRMLCALRPAVLRQHLGALHRGGAPLQEGADRPHPLCRLPGEKKEAGPGAGSERLALVGRQEWVRTRGLGPCVLYFCSWLVGRAWSGARAARCQLRPPGQPRCPPASAAPGLA